MILPAGSLVGTPEYNSVYKKLNNTCNEPVAKAPSVPTLVEVARSVAQHQGTKMDKKQ